MLLYISKYIIINKVKLVEIFYTKYQNDVFSSFLDVLFLSINSKEDFLIIHLLIYIIFALFKTFIDHQYLLLLNLPNLLNYLLIMSFQ